MRDNYDTQNQKKLFFLMFTPPEQTSTIWVTVSKPVGCIQTHTISAQLLILEAGKVSRYHQGKQAPASPKSQHLSSLTPFASLSQTCQPYNGPVRSCYADKSATKFLEFSPSCCTVSLFLPLMG